MRFTTFISSLIKNNTGVSSKNAALVIITAVSVILLIIVGIVLLVDVFYDHTVSTDLNGLAALIASIAGLLVSVGLPKAISEKYDKGGSPPTVEN